MPHTHHHTHLPLCCRRGHRRLCGHRSPLLLRLCGVGCNHVRLPASCRPLGLRAACCGPADPSGKPSLTPCTPCSLIGALGFWPATVLFPIEMYRKIHRPGLGMTIWLETVNVFCFLITVCGMGVFCASLSRRGTNRPAASQPPRHPPALSAWAPRFRAGLRHYGIGPAHHHGCVQLRHPLLSAATSACQAGSGRTRPVGARPGARLLQAPTFPRTQPRSAQLGPNPDRDWEPQFLPHAAVNALSSLRPRLHVTFPPP
jgi:hypothetical protein